METQTAIETRRSVKAYDPDHVMSEAEIENLLSLTMLSPTAFNLQHWRFLVVRDPQLRQQIKEASWNQPHVTDASLLVVICADLKAWERQPERCFTEIPEEACRKLVAMIDGHYRGNIQAQRDEALRSCGIAAQTLMLAARDMGYDSCPMCGFDFDKVGELINLPEDHLISMFIVVGKALEPARPRMGQLPMAEIVSRDRFFA